MPPNAIPSSAPPISSSSNGDAHRSLQLFAIAAAFAALGGLWARGLFQFWPFERDVSFVSLIERPG
jgi:hypothetical protein